MNLLTGYGSEEDEPAVQTVKNTAATDSKWHAPAQTASKPPATTAAKVEVKEGSKKKRIELLNLLPANIQAALQGHTAYDSDSDGESQHSHTATSEKNTIQPKEHNKTKDKVTQSALLSLLPKAKDNEEFMPAPVAKVIVNESLKGKFSAPLEASEPRFQASIVSNSKINSKTTANKFSMPLEFPATEYIEKKAVSTGNSSFSLEDGDDDGEYLDAAKSSLFTFAEKKSTEVKLQSYHLDSGMNQPSETNDSVPEHDSFSVPVPIYTQEEYEQYYQAYYQYQQQLLYPQLQPQLDEEDQDTTPGRKRNRKLESELLNGNINVVQEKNCSVANPSKWDKEKYMEKRKYEEEIGAVYKFGGTTGSLKAISQPNRLQNKKHQINSLAMAAANAEIEMYDSRGTRNKTKAETQAKYGW